MSSSCKERRERNQSVREASRIALTPGMLGNLPRAVHRDGKFVRAKMITAGTHVKDDNCFGFSGGTRSVDVAFRDYYTVGPTISGPFEAQARSLHAHCLRFTAWVTPALRKTRFRFVGSTLAGQDFHLLGSVFDFPVG